MISRLAMLPLASLVWAYTPGVPQRLYYMTGVDSFEIPAHGQSLFQDEGGIAFDNFEGPPNRPYSSFEPSTEPDPKACAAAHLPLCPSSSPFYILATGSGSGDATPTWTRKGVPQTSNPLERLFDVYSFDWGCTAYGPNGTISAQGQALQSNVSRSCSTTALLTDVNGVTTTKTLSFQTDKFFESSMASVTLSPPWTNLTSIVWKPTLDEPEGYSSGPRLVFDSVGWGGVRAGDSEVYCAGSNPQPTCSPTYASTVPGDAFTPAPTLTSTAAALVNARPTTAATLTPSANRGSPAHPRLL